MCISLIYVKATKFKLSSFWIQNFRTKCWFFIRRAIHTFKKMQNFLTFSFSIVSSVHKWAGNIFFPMVPDLLALSM